MVLLLLRSIGFVIITNACYYTPNYFRTEFNVKQFQKILSKAQKIYTKIFYSICNKLKHQHFFVHD